MKNLVCNILFFIMLAGALALTVLNLAPYIREIAGFEWYLIIAAAACLVAGALVASFISVLLHELGHMLFGLFCGFKILSFRLFRTETIYLNGRRIKKKRDKDFCYGRCVMVSKKEGREKGRLIISASGGLLLSFLVFAGYLLANVLLDGISPYIYAAVSPGLLVSLYIFLSSFLPYRSAGGRSDGSMIRDLNRDPAFAAAMENLMRIETQLYQGRSPSEIDGDLYFKAPMISDDHVTMFSLFYHRYHYFLDMLDFEKAAETDRKVIELGDFLPPKEHAKLYLNACFDFILSGDTEKAKACYSDDYEDDMTTYRIKAYYCRHILDDDRKAKAYVNRAREEAEREPFRGIAMMEGKLLDWLDLSSKQKPEEKQEPEEERKPEQNQEPGEKREPEQKQEPEETREPEQKQEPGKKREDGEK